MELKGARAGQFKPSCAACKTKFRLEIPPGDNPTPKTSLIEGQVSDDAMAALGLASPKPRRPAASMTQTAVGPASGGSIAGGSISGGSISGVTLAPGDSLAGRSLAGASAAGVSAAGASAVGATVVAPSNMGATSIPTPQNLNVSGENHSGAYHTIAKASSPEPDVTVGERLGGYELIKRLGAGGMGSVYLARQVSLDREVALKLLSPELATDPQFVARFTREAYAAAQLSHHNIVAIHDIGNEKDQHFFSMEFVRGKSLANLLDEKAILEPQAAVAYTLQAARGLAFAHSHGMVHRDVKPDNLLLSEQGMVKVADLGLVKRTGVAETMPAPGSAPVAGQKLAEVQRMNQTQADVYMGTPAYMPPEQASDAASVDQRADVYSLGCTLYHLLTGRPPFTGQTAIEVITKHQKEQIVPPDVIVKNVPHALATILMKMLAKKPDDRYTMPQAISSLEEFLGMGQTNSSGEKASPLSGEQARNLTAAAQLYSDCSAKKLRKQVIWGFVGVCALLAIVFAFVGLPSPFNFGIPAVFVGIPILSTLIYQIIIGVQQKTTLFARARSLIFGASFFDWIVVVLGFALVCLLLWAFGLIWWWTAGAVLALALSFVFFTIVDGMVSKQREPAIGTIEKIMRDLRMKGVDETDIHQLVLKHAGDEWEELYEELFGYEEKMSARKFWGQSYSRRSRTGAKHAAWREPIIAWIDDKLAARRAKREAKLLEKLEGKAAVAGGVDPAVAKKQAKLMADQFVARAAKLKAKAQKQKYKQEKADAKRAKKEARKASQKGIQGLIDDAAHQSASGTDDKLVLVGNALEGDDEEGSESSGEGYLKRRYGGPLDIVFGRLPRFVLAALLIALFGVWFQQNDGRDMAKGFVDVTESRRDEATEQVARREFQAGTVTAGDVEAMKPVPKLTIKGIPDSWLTPFDKGWPTGLAGALLLIGSVFRGRMLAVGVLASSALALFGHLYEFPVVGQIDMRISMAAAAILWFLSIFFLRETKY
jgi:eukaryotic-like serine/threonine-protein kinase